MELIVTEICKVCSNQFSVKETGKRRSNGALERFYTYPAPLIGCYHIKCYKCHRETLNSKRKPDSAKKYEKTVNGFLVRTYRNMKSRVKGIQKKKAHLYKGLEILSKDEFYDWSRSSNRFKALYERWKLSDYRRTLTPSIDRINPKQGYTLGNMRWLTHSENSRLGAISRNKK
jgi:hypothetical protein